MAITLSNGYILPENGDLGSTWFPALEANISRINSHNHNGTNGERLSHASFSPVLEQVLEADFALNSDSTYYEHTRNVVADANLTNTRISFRDPVTKTPLLLEYFRVTETSYTIQLVCPLDVEVVYG